MSSRTLDHAQARARRTRAAQRGLTIMEATLVLSLVAALLVPAFGAYRGLRSEVSANDLAQGAVQLATGVQSVFGAQAAYGSVTSARINHTGLVPSGWRYSSGDLFDNRGNVVAISASATTFTMLLQEMSSADCARAATQIAAAAHQVRIGAAVTGVAGALSGGQEYKSTDGALSADALATGCGEAGRRIGVVVR